MARTPNNVAGFALLPIEFPASSVLTIPTKHYIYLKPHDPQIPDPNASRSLLVANIPVTATKLHFKHLFARQEN
jgi:ribosomal RNA-processing protein 7